MLRDEKAAKGLEGALDDNGGNSAPPSEDCLADTTKGVGSLVDTGGMAEKVWLVTAPKDVGALSVIGGKVEVLPKAGLADTPKGVGGLVDIGGKAESVAEACLAVVPKEKGVVTFVARGGNVEPALAPPNGTLLVGPKGDDWLAGILVSRPPPNATVEVVLNPKGC